ncbi:hypothetical protein CHS0354_040825 [Potamilus streckersoni]|uniref:Uncharacterized protein n=1 Tax=Potamilus streckersoni TaxID=2493646 RepID=A0AAE0VXS3_9BIVA|nr:hypothetical protein CHS0354_040825 [Potamilus streckersoni]
MKTLVGFALCILIATVSAQLYDRRLGVIGGIGGIEGIGGIGGIGGIDGIGGIGGIDGIGGIGGGIGIGSTYCPSTYCLNGQCSQMVRYAYYLGRRCYCSCTGY